MLMIIVCIRMCVSVLHKLRSLLSEPPVTNRVYFICSVDHFTMGTGRRVTPASALSLDFLEVDKEHVTEAVERGYGLQLKYKGW